MTDGYEQTARMLKAIADPKRMEILDLLTSEEMCASDLLGHFRIAQPTLSHDMKTLVDAGVVRQRREGRRIYYRLDCEKLGGMHKNLMQIFSGGMDCDCCRNAAQPFAVEEAPPREGDA